MYKNRTNSRTSSPAPRNAPEYTEEDLQAPTQQHFKEQVDIHNIIQRAQPQRLAGSRGAPQYGDFRTASGQIPTLGDMEMARIRRDQIWAHMPASVRARFRTPEEFLIYTEDPAHTDEIMAMYGVPPAKKSDQSGASPIVPLDTMGLTDTASTGSGKMPDTAKPIQTSKTGDVA